MLKKRLVFLGLLLAASIVGQILLRPCLGESNAATNPSPKTDAVGSWNVQTGKSIDSLGGKLAGRFFLMIGFVAAAGVAVWWSLKKMNAPWLNSKGGQLELIEMVHLGPRKAIHLIRAGKKYLLVGSSNEGIRFLSDLTGNIETPPAEAKP